MDFVGEEEEEKGKRRRRRSAPSMMMIILFTGGVFIDKQQMNVGEVEGEGIPHPPKSSFRLDRCLAMFLCLLLGRVK